MFRKFVISGLMAVGLLMLSSPDAQAQAAPKPDGCGVKWSGVKMCVEQKIPLENGECVEIPPTWRPWWPARPYCYVGYKADLINPCGTKTDIKVWVAKSGQNPVNPGEDPKKWCHGSVFGCCVYSPGGAEVPAILKSGYDEYDWDEDGAEQKEGDVLIFCRKMDGPNGAKKGDVGHSAEYIGGGKYCSKNGYLGKVEQTKAQIQMDYPPEIWDCKCYTPKAAVNDDDTDNTDNDGGDDTGNGNTTGNQLSPNPMLGAAFYTQQANPQHSGVLHYIHGEVEMKYVHRSAFLDYSQGISALQIKSRRDGRFEVRATLTHQGLAEVQRAVEASPYGEQHPLFLVFKDEVHHQYTLADFMQPTVSLGVFSDYSQAADWYWNIIM